MKAESENDVLKGCLQYLTMVRRWLAWRQNNGGMYDKARGCYRSFAGMKGVSDLIAVHDGTVYFIECKKQGGKLRPEQIAFGDAVRAAGGVYIVARSVSELIAALAEVEDVA